MNELVFQVEFLSDIVLPATSNTEGNIEQLDFIPGSNFLGMVAQAYADFGDSFAVFHSGKVRFGDATPVVNNEASYKMPLSFFHEKLDDTKMINHHLVEDFSEYKQLKQKRKGYITRDMHELNINHNYAQKSAYNKEKRRSEDGSMYGYQSITSGTLWQFIVQYDESIEKQDIQKIETMLQGKKRLGKSKSSQYGRVEISKSSKLPMVPCIKNVDETVVLYAKSRLALVDEEGMPTYNLKYLTDGIEDHNIIWEKCQIKTSLYTPYNGAMQTKSYERAVIKSGSVIVLKDISETQLNNLKNGIGVYLSEGFGEVFVNPEFLVEKGEFSFMKSRIDDIGNKVTPKDSLSMFLAKREVNKREQLDTAIDVNKFIVRYKKLYGKISNSQWGTIRSICSGFGDGFREEIRDYVSDGKVTWTTEQVETLLQENNSKVFIKLLSMQMPKIKKEK